MTPLRGGAAGGAGDRLHRRLDQRLAGRGVHSDPADGRDRRPAVPRIRGHAVGGDRRVAGRLADDHADDVRRAAASRTTDEQHGRLYRGERARLRLDPRRATSARCAGCCGISCSRCWSRWPRSGSTVYLYVIVPKGFFPQQDTGRLIGHRSRPTRTRRSRRWSELLTQFAAIVGDDPAVDSVDRLHRRRRRRHVNTGAHVRRAQAAGRAQADAPTRSSRGCAASSPQIAGRDAVPAGRAGSARRRPRQQRAVSVHAAGRQPAAS